MSGPIGQGDLTFGTLVAEFEADPGFTIDGKSVPAVKCTPASATTEQYGAGNIADYGLVTGTLIVDTTTLVADLDTLIGTTATLVVKYPLKVGTNTTIGGWTGTAIFLKAPQVTSPNEILRGAAEFQWTGKPTPIDEVA